MRAASQEPQGSQTTSSLIKRLAGPSTGKAGLAKDQTDINRVIAEASKGSKFYENEKKKDKEVTERIQKILKQRDEAVKGVDMSKIESVVDLLLAELENQRDLSQIIVHVDMDAFYASVELLDNPSLKGKPFAVGHGVLSTASYEARKYGVRSGMAGFIAKKLCPDLILLDHSFEKYSEMSNRVMDIFAQYDPNMCPAGCDEGYLNITIYCEDHSVTADQCVEEMRRRVFEETKLTVSAGIAPNKMLAKICSDKNKPNGQYHLPFDSQSVKDFMRELPIRKIPGIGRVNERLLDSIGIKVCGDIFIYRGTLQLLDKHFGLKHMLQTYLGIASNIVEPHHREDTKSIGAERTFNTIDDKTKILQKLEEVAQELENDMHESGWVGRTVTLKFKLDTYQVFTRAKSFDRWISKKEDLFATGKELLLPELPAKIRLIGLRVTRLKDLRAAEPVNGIKRFFAATSEDSSTKRRRVDLDDHPEENDADDSSDSDCQIVEKPADRPRPPVSAPPRSSQTSPSEAVPSTSPQPKPRSAYAGQAVQDLDRKTKQECPVCGKNMDMTNQELNAHIDFCLSRGAIWKAQSEASGTSATSKSSSKLKGKGKR